MIRRGHQVLPIIFPDCLVHEDMANAVIALLENMDGEKLKPRRAIAAGDVTLFDVSCNGESQTLGLVSREHADELSMTVGHYTGYWDD